MGTTFNILDGGSITGHIYGLNSFEDSVINILGGSVRSFHASGNSQVTVSGGEMVIFDTSANSEVAVSGGSMYRLSAYDNSRIHVSGGYMLGLDAYNGSHVTFSGGSTYKDLYGQDSSRVALCGGSIQRDLRVRDNAVFTIDGRDFAVDGTPVGYIELSSILGGNHWSEADRRLTGTLLNGDPLDNNFYIGDSAKIILIPEPGTLLLLGLGCLMLRKRRRA